MVNISICIVTYNHVPYIEECLQSVLSQCVDFSYEILIGDDGSTDNTSEICRTYAEKYPEKIKHFIWDRSEIIQITKDFFDCSYFIGKYIKDYL